MRQQSSFPRSAWERSASTLRVATFAAVAFVLLAVSALPAQDSFTQTAAEVNKKMVKLFGAGGFKGMPSYGTGFLVSGDGYILTVNNHILGTPDLRVHLAD